jgi:protein-tyrosine phosphatase
MGHYVDLHAHFLAGLDDGARTLEASLQMVGALAALGFDTLNATPHQRAGMFMPHRAAIDQALAATRGRAADSFPALSIGVAAENFWDEVLHDRLQQGQVPSYPGDKAFLFEVSPQMLPPRLEATLFSIRLAGRLPVLAHPERYHALQSDLGRAEALGRSTALLVDLGALDGAHGRAGMKTARRLLEDGIAHAVTSDMHTPEDLGPVSAGMAWIRKRLGADALERLLGDHPRRILAGEIP